MNRRTGVRTPGVTTYTITKVHRAQTFLLTQFVKCSQVFFWCMDPTAEECAAFKTIQDVFEWLEMDPPLCAALTAATGAKSSLRSWARIPAERYTEVLKTLMVNDGGVERRQTPAEEGQAGDVRRIALLALQGPSASARAGGGKGQQHTSQSAGIQGSAGQAATGAMGSGAVSGQGGLGELTGTSGGPETGRDNAGAGRPALGASKIKISMVMDQADDTEIQPLHPGVLRNMIEHWKTNSNDGEDPTEGEEATGDQLSALAFRTRSGGTPFVDFGGWRLHGTDMGKALEFSAFFTCLVSGEYVKEISVPETIGDWNRAWRVFSFAMEILGAATRTRLERYSDRVQQMAEDYHDLWWIIACAEHKMRKFAPRTYQAPPCIGVWDFRLPSSQMHLGTWLSARSPGTSTFGPPRSTRRFSNSAPLRGRGTSS